MSPLATHQSNNNRHSNIAFKPQLSVIPSNAPFKPQLAMVPQATHQSNYAANNIANSNWTSSYQWTFGFLWTMSRSRFSTRSLSYPLGSNLLFSPSSNSCSTKTARRLIILIYLQSYMSTFCTTKQEIYRNQRWQIEQRFYAELYS